MAAGRSSWTIASPAGALSAQGNRMGDARSGVAAGRRCPATPLAKHGRKGDPPEGAPGERWLRRQRGDLTKRGADEGVIEVTGLTKVTGGQAVVDDIRSTYGKGVCEIFGIPGPPKGAGKRPTAVRVHGGLSRRERGEGAAEIDAWTRCERRPAPAEPADRSAAEERQLQDKLEGTRGARACTPLLPKPGRLGASARALGADRKADTQVRQALRRPPEAAPCSFAMALLGNPEWCCFLRLDDLGPGAGRARHATWDLYRDR